MLKDMTSFLKERPEKYKILLKVISEKECACKGVVDLMREVKLNGKIS